MPNDFKKFPNWQNFAKSGHTDRFSRLVVPSKKKKEQGKKEIAIQLPLSSPLLCHLEQRWQWQAKQRCKTFLDFEEAAERAKKLFLLVLLQRMRKGLKRAKMDRCRLTEKKAWSRCSKQILRALIGCSKSHDYCSPISGHYFIPVSLRHTKMCL